MMRSERWACHGSLGEMREPMEIRTSETTSRLRMLQCTIEGSTNQKLLFGVKSGYQKYLEFQFGKSSRRVKLKLAMGLTLQGAVSEIRKYKNRQICKSGGIQWLWMNSAETTCGLRFHKSREWTSRQKIGLSVDMLSWTATFCRLKMETDSGG